MGISIEVSTKRYLEFLAASGSNTKLLGKFQGMKSPIEHVCGGCGTKFQDTPNKIKSYTMPVCRVCRLNTHEHLKKVDEILQYLEAYDNIDLVKWERPGNPIFICHLCNVEFTSGKIKRKGRSSEFDGCGKCWNKFQKEEARKDFLKNAQLAGFTVGTYTRANRLVTVECNTCKWSSKIPAWKVTQGSLVCRICNPLNSYKNKKVQFKGKAFVLQGAEEEALKFFDSIGMKVKDLWAYTSGKVPEVSYKFKGMPKMYRPDFLYQGNLLEVKSTFTLMDEWEKNCAKAKAASKQYTYRMFVKIKATFVELPSNWFTLDKHQVLGFLRRTESPKIRILSMDPGTANFAWSVLEACPDSPPKLLGYGMVKNTIVTMTGNMVNPIGKFVAEIHSICEEFGVKAVIMERFMFRRGLNGSTMECVNTMIGAVLGYVHECFPNNTATLTIPASQWKNAYNSKFNLEKTYLDSKQTAHIIDSALIGIYFSGYLYNLPYFDLPNKFFKDLWKNLEKQDFRKLYLLSKSQVNTILGYIHQKSKKKEKRCEVMQNVRRVGNKDKFGTKKGVGVRP
jgi:hypothetical protein